MGVNAGTAHKHGGLNTTPDGGRRAGFAGSFAARKAGEIRTGGGVDSHAAVTRFLGVSSDVLMNDRLPDTDFEQISASVRSNGPVDRSRLVTSYSRTNQDNGERYDQLLGGDGNLISELNGLSLDLFYARIERLNTGVRLRVAHLLAEQPARRAGESGGQRQQHRDDRPRTGADDRQRTSGQVASRCPHERNCRRRRCLLRASGLGGIQRQPGYQRGIDPPSPRARSGDFRRAACSRRPPRPVPERLRLVGAVGSEARYNASAADARSSTARRCGPTIRCRPRARRSVLGGRDARRLLDVSGSVSRGFRAPHMTDLGTLGLTGSGFEVAAPDVAGMAGSSVRPPTPRRCPPETGRAGRSRDEPAVRRDRWATAAEAGARS